MRTKKGAVSVIINGICAAQEALKNKEIEK